MGRKSFIPLVECLPTNRLPTEIQVLGHFLWQRTLQICKRSPRTAALITVSEVLHIWKIAYIPVMDEKDVMRKFFNHESSIVKRLVVDSY